MEDHVDGMDRLKEGKEDDKRDTNANRYTQKTSSTSFRSSASLFQMAICQMVSMKFIHNTIY